MARNLSWPLALSGTPDTGASSLAQVATQLAGSRWQAVRDWLARPRSARTLVVWLGLYLTLACNWPLWGELMHIGNGQAADYLPHVALMALLVACGSIAMLSLSAWSRWMKPLWMAVVLVAAVSQHYMATYGVVMDPTMMANATQTDMSEVRDLLNWRLLFNVLLVSALPMVVIWHARLRRERLLSQVWRNAVLLLAVAAVALGAALAMNRELAPLMRNHTKLRYMTNPLAPVYSAVMTGKRVIFKHQRKLIPVSGGAALGASYADQAKPPLFVVVVGETARADHFALNGYERDTTPQLAARKVLSWKNVHSCGTSTLASVPCMFSPLGKAGYESASDDYENLADVLQAAGLAVFWLDNQPGGCKGVCDRVPHASAFADLDSVTKTALCPGGDECLDEVMLRGLDARIEALPAERRARGVVLLMHQMGSHGPAYYQRSSRSTKRFMPECKVNVLSDCSHDELLNAFDNSIAYTDDFLGKTIDWLKARSDRYDTAMLYLSDHGESLGEFGLFLHGMPYGVAPEVQKHVPWVMWFSDGMREREKLSRNCLEGELDKPLTHDNLYHTVLGTMDVQSPTYKPGLDALGECRGDALAGKPSPKVTRALG
ncbi:phosphoethanolamine transferase [Variovorax sp. OV329]|uniref:phosphoethanolamine transferase n=1 Tax=Variovorax sp. OV329 TaxID=1882825 RepID=UPI0008ED20E7|nr:phosphoethanolamine--lipid A transferase [Variovorax sp. OV329]SFN39242.1 lipid A ethanolaminephosphotransferase [Variovorax sp. OV329]